MKHTVFALSILMGLLLSSPVRAQNNGTPYDCLSVFSFTAASSQTGQNNSSSASPCVAWRVTYTSTGFSSVTVYFETSPDNSSWTPVTNSICSSSIQPPCVTDGANPLAADVMGSSSFRAYGKYVRVRVSSVTGSGSGQVVTYGYKGTSASAGLGADGGGSPQLHAITIPIAGTPIVTGTSGVGTPATANFSCTINKAQAIADASGSITVDVWKAAGAIPGSGNKISSTHPVTLSSAQLNQNSALTSWTTSVSAGDVFWANVATVDGSLTSATVQLWCQ